MATVASSVLSQYQSSTTSNSTTGASSTMGKDAFLKLLVTQLSHQDPLNPMDDKDMTAQLAQFSSLEQLTNINTGIETLNTTMTQNQLTNAVSYIGKSVKASGYSLSKEDGTVSNVYYSLGETVSDASINIYDADGTLVRSVGIGTKSSGEYEYGWDGLDSSGEEVADGLYSVAITAYNSSGKQVMVQTQVSGIVSGVTTSNGSAYLNLKDGRTVALTNVSQIVNPSSVSSNASSASSGTAS